MSIRIKGGAITSPMTKEHGYKGLRKAVKDLKKEASAHRLTEKALEESSKKIKFFAYSVSHDLKNPAVGLYGLAKRLHRDYAEVLDEKGRRYCEQILKTAEQIASLVEQINVFIATKEAPLTIEKLKPKEILQIVREEYSAQLSVREIRWSEPDNIPEIKADRLSIIRALRNIIDNTMKYGTETLSEINIKYKGSDEFHIFSVKDDGIGLKDRPTHEDIFAPFIRSRTSKGIQGSGLGLTILREIAERHGGEVWMKVGRERGITIFLSISKALELS